MSLEAKKTIVSMSFGIVLYEIILAIVFIPISKYLGYSLIKVELGILFGTILLYASLVHMAYVTTDVLASKDEEYANKKTVSQAMIRKVFLIIILLICYFTYFVNVLSVVIAMLGMKMGAYLAPFVTKKLEKIKK